MNRPPAEAEPLFDAHLDLVLERFEQGLAACSLDALVVDAGGPGVWFLDDIASDWRVNPHFRLLTPCDPADGSSVLLRPGERPVLLHLVPEDFWHLPPAAPEGAWTRRFEIRTVRDASEREQVIGEWLGNLRAARIGPDAGLDGAVHNPSNLMTHLDYGRARKTEYEIACMRAANRRAAAGHRAAEVHGRRAVEVRHVHLVKRTGTREDAGVVHDDVERILFALDPVHSCPNRFVFGHVQSDRVLVGRGDVVSVARTGVHGRSEFGQPRGDLGTDPAGRSRDEGDVVREGRLEFDFGRRGGHTDHSDARPIELRARGRESRRTFDRFRRGLFDRFPTDDGLHP
jgi:hypothetical protein